MKKLLTILLFIIITNIGFSQAIKVAVLDFENTSGKADYNGLGKSMSNMLITDLQNNIHPRKVEFYERGQINKLLKEQELQKGKNFDSKTAVEFGKMSGVNYVFLGSIFVLNGSLNITAKLVEVKSSKIIISQGIDGSIGSFLKLKSQLAYALANALNNPIVLDSNYLNVGTSLPTLNQYAKLLTSLDNGDIEKAEELRKIFEETNPEFKYFLDIKDDIEKLKKRVTELENLTSILTNDFELGDIALTKLDFNNTIKYFEKFIGNPGNQDYLENKKLFAYGKLAFSYLKLGDFQNSLKNARSANKIYSYYPESNEIELFSLLELKDYDNAKKKYDFILDSINYANELSFIKENKNELLVWKLISSFTYGLICKINENDDDDVWCYAGMTRSGYSSPPINEFKIKTVLKENNIDFKILEQGINQYLKLEKKLLDLNSPEIFSSNNIIGFYKLSYQYAEQLEREKNYKLYIEHLVKEVKRIENFGVLCIAGCFPNTKIPLSDDYVDKQGRRAYDILRNLGLSNSKEEFYDNFHILYGKFIFNYFIELIRQGKTKEAAIIYNNFFTEHPDKNDNYLITDSYYISKNNYFRGQPWDIILGIRVWDNENFNSKYPLSKNVFKIEFEKKIIKELKILKIPIINFENIKFN